MNQNIPFNEFKINLVFVKIFPVPLLNLLSVNLRLLGNEPLWQSFISLYEISTTDLAAAPVHFQEIIPSLLCDPIALLIKYILLAPLRMDLGKIHG